MQVPALRDAAVALPVSVVTSLDAWWNEPGTRQADGLTYGLLVVSLVALLFRSRWPLPVALACGAALSGWYVLGHHGELLNLPTMVALYTVAVQGDRRRSVVVGVVAAAWSGVLGFTSDDPLGARGGSPMLEVLVPLVPLALGEAARVRRELLAEHAARAAAAEAEAAREADRRAEAERVGMARELHDVVAHTMAAVNVQMGVAITAFDTEPETARTALVQARASSRAALVELRAALAALRQDGPPEPAAPAPRLAEVEDLAAVARAAGIDVSVRLDGVGDGLPAAVELAAYRIVQEALTNVVRHSGARHAAVSARHEGDTLVVEVVDDGAGPAAPGAGAAGPAGDREPRAGVADPVVPGARAAGPSGFGLVGVTERASALGGAVEHGRGAEGGFRVRAVLPTGATA